MSCSRYDDDDDDVMYMNIEIEIANRQPKINNSYISAKIHDREVTCLLCISNFYICSVARRLNPRSVNLHRE